MRKRSIMHRITLTISVAVVSVMILGGPMFVPRANAQLATTVVADTPQQIEQVLDEILTALTRAGVVAFFNAAQVFFGQLAYDAATYLASGGTGQAALVYEKGFGDYLGDVAGDAAGELLGSLSDDSFFQDIGFDICKPQVPGQLLDIQLGLGSFLPNMDTAGQGNFERPRPRCDFQDVINNYEQLYTTLSNSEITDFVSVNFQPGGSDLSVTSQIFGRSIAKISGDSAKKQLTRGETGGFKDVSGSISGFTKTPASLVEGNIKTTLVEQPAKDQGAIRNTIIESAFEQGFVQLAIYTASVFLNTLVSKLMERVFEQGLVGAFDFSRQAAELTRPDSITVAGKTDARKANIALRDVQLIKTGEIELVGELIACPENRGTWNCTADEGLAQAIQSRTSEGNYTLKQALELNLLHGDWRLLPDTLARENLDRQCYTYAYCTGNLKKLRALRILPVGFELAANAQENINRCAQASGCATLREVVDGFSDCNTSGERDASHPWCRLIDPNWVITAFAQQCQLQGFSETLLTKRLPQRKEECQDVQTCLQRNDRGECIGGYGYCIAEKNVYRFNADECPAQFASCRNFTSRQGQSVSFVRNTLDASVCGAENVGCLSYATNRNAAGEWSGAGDRIYFDAAMQTCPASAEGCTKLYAAEVGRSSLNFLLNPSFELVSGAAESLESWSPDTSGVTSVTAGAPSSHGVRSLPLTGVRRVTQDVNLVAGSLYTLSFFARAGDGAGASNNARAQVAELRSDGSVIPDSTLSVNFRSSGCDATTSTARIVTDDVGTDWRRFQCTFLASTETSFGRVSVSAGAGSTLVDAIQLEESQFATVFVDGINTSLPTLHMKVAPDEYECTGADTDNPACNDFAKMCRQIDAGCQGYTNVSGGPEVPAILSANDLCPASCVGYAEYRKTASAFDLIEDVDPRFSDPTDNQPDYFIASSGLQCSQEDVGCEVFTNIEAAAEGGEQTQAFNYLRTCQLPSDRSTTYFTWEGSEDAGFQLRTWSLIQDSNPANEGPAIIEKRSPDGSFKEPATCNEGLWRSGLDPDCRQFYNSDGDVFYRYFSQTILSTEECQSWRLTDTNANDCSLTGGSFSASTGQCIYQHHVPESRTCRAQFAGCRAYNGSSAGNVQTILSHNFRDAVAPFESGRQSTESLLVGDQSLLVEPDVSGVTLTSVVIPDTEEEDLLRTAFWAKAPGRPDVVVTLSTAPGDTPAATLTPVGSVRIGTDWQRFDIGLFNGAAGTTSTRLIFTFVADTGAAPSVFLDEVYINTVNDVAYVVKNSWNTPIECDQSNAGAPEPQAMLGCSTNTDRFGNNVNAYRFTNLCRAEAIGCRAFVDTRNSDAVGAEAFEMGDATPIPVFNDPATTYPSNTTIRPADRMLYMIYEQSKVCQAENASCRAFGKTNYSPDRSISTFETVYYKDDITRYGEALCRPSEEFCEAFTYAGAQDHFRDPQNHVCEYRDSVRMSGDDFAAGDPLAGLPTEEIIYSGWFIAGSQPPYPCYPGNLEGGTFFNISRRGDPTYTGWVGMCPREQGECTEFRDPNDTSDPIFRESGKPYFFIRNERLDTRSCAGNIDVGTGCILLRDQSDTALTYSVAASYHAYEQNDFDPTSPINCARTPSHPSCVATSSTSTDANVLINVSVDRDCAQWLGCASSESVYDPATREFKDVCVDLALCDKSTQIPGDIFCANYVDRHPAKEPIMSEGTYFDVGVYASRDVGLGRLDYSGYALPNAFQVMDLVSTRVGAEGANDVPNNENRFALDYRLAATADIPVDPDTGAVVEPTSPNQARILDRIPGVPPADDPIALANPNLNLCQHVGTGIIGYFLPDDRDAAEVAGASPSGSPRPFPCFLPIRGNLGDVNFHNISQKFSIDDPRTDPLLTNAYPSPECRAHPEADAPFPEKFVTRWDFTTTPPSPVNVAEGFASANTCEFGEDCSCTYKRADYQGVESKFFDVFSQNVPPGVCVGGPRNGQSCLPTAIFNPGTGEAESSASLVNGVLAANASQTCGPPFSGGQCIPFSKLEIIRGIFGQCLERDTTRVLGGDLSAYPCLTWNPTPILFGDKDPFHYQPTSGYLPPQNSGQYYCASAVRKPSSVEITQQQFKRFEGNQPAVDPRTLESFRDELTVDAGTVIGAFFGFPIPGVDSASNQYGEQFMDHPAKYAGRMTRMEYDEQWVSPDNRCAPDECDFRTPSLFGVSAVVQRYPSALRCEQADDHQGNVGGNQDFTAVRLVDAGSGYSETFFRINDAQMAAALGSSGTTDYVNLLNDNTISYFNISPIENGEAGRLACGYQAEWADNMPSIDYGNAESINQGESAWRREFFSNYNPYVTRGSEQLLTVQSGDLARARCVADNATSSECFFKTWEADYRSSGKDKFYGIFNDETRANVTRSFMNIREAPVIGTCETDKPYFAIRALFQTDAPAGATSAAGPWKFVGFWVSACGGDTGGDQRYMYMNIEMGSVSVCNQLAEVKSFASNSDAAFTDRIWANGVYTEPGTGIQYSARSAPFSSALNTGPAGEEPLFQAGFELAGFSPLDPPIFLQAGDQTYYRDRPLPNEKYQFITNLFARIYRVYRFHFQPVSTGDEACLEGPMKGVWCDSSDDVTGADRCDVDGACDSSLLSLSDRFDLRACNRSISRDVLCLADDRICQAPSFTESGTARVVSVRNNCVERTDVAGDFRCAVDKGWNVERPGGAGGRDAGTPGTATLTDDDLANQPTCSFVEDDSPDCPVSIDGTCNTTRNACNLGTIEDRGALRAVGLTVTQDALLSDPGAGEITFVEGQRISCRTNDDCKFTTAHFGTDDAQRSSCVVGTETQAFGRCRGGLRENALCKTAVTAPGVPFSCGVDMPSSAKTSYRNSCDAVSDADGSPVSSCLGTNRDVPTTSSDPDADNNICTHGTGYVPRLDLCPNPDDEYCGLVSYKIAGASSDASLNPRGAFPAPTDVTLGHYTPYFVGWIGATGDGADLFDYISYYTPRPPRVAAPDTRNCPVPGQCPISREDKFAFNGQSEGVINAGGGQHKSSLRFYAWAEHNQMPLRKLVVDWGDSEEVRLENSKLKNRKPFCSVVRECSDPIRGQGLTCQTDSDCPPGTGQCLPLGACEQKPNVSCRRDSDCGADDTCRIRTMFGNSSEACQADYFDFTHVYRCGAFERLTLPDCSSGQVIVPENTCYFGDVSHAILTGGDGFGGAVSCTSVSNCNDALTRIGESVPPTPSDVVSCGPPVAPPGSVVNRCSRNTSVDCDTDADCPTGDECLSGLAPVNGCFDALSNSCRYTPRLMLEDNWGWCTGECRVDELAGSPEDDPSSTVKHLYGGCYSGSVLERDVDGSNIRFNTRSDDIRPSAGVGVLDHYVTGYLPPDTYTQGECSEILPGASGDNANRRPWIVYPGSIQVRFSGEVVIE